MAQRHCLACRTFLVCLWRSAMQVLTCNTTAVQFVSRGGEGALPGSGPWGGGAAAASRAVHLPQVQHHGRSPRQTGLGTSGCQKLSPAEHLLQVRGPRNRSVCHRPDQCVSVILVQTSLPDWDMSHPWLLSVIFVFSYCLSQALRTPKQNLSLVTPSVTRF